MLHGKAPPHSNARQWGWWARKTNQILEERHFWNRHGWTKGREANTFTNVLDFWDHTNSAQMVSVFCQLFTAKAAIILLAFYAGILEVQTSHLRGKKRKRPNNSSSMPSNVRASQLWRRIHHSAFWAQTETLPQSNLKLEASGLEEVSEVVCHWKEGHRIFFPLQHKLHRP